MLELSGGSLVANANLTSYRLGPCPLLAISNILLLTGEVRSMLLQADQDVLRIHIHIAVYTRGLFLDLQQTTFGIPSRLPHQEETSSSNLPH